MIRLILLALLVAGFSIYAFRDWYKSLCALIVLMAVIEHPDMPNSIFGIQGFNPWNILLFFVIIGWAVSRQQEKLRWDMPANIKLFLFLYFLVMIIGFFHMLVDKGSLAYYQMITTNKVHSTAYLWSEYFINTIKKFCFCSCC